MPWTFPQHQTFQRCRRRWFCRYAYASPCAEDPARREVFRLSRLVSLKAWRDGIVGRAIADTVVPAVNRKQQVDAAATREYARGLFDEQRSQGLRLGSSADGGFGGFLEVEKGYDLTDADFEEAWSDAEKAFGGFFRNIFTWERLEHAAFVVSRKRLSYRLDGVTVEAVPDAICFFPHGPAVVLDWKVEAKPVGRYWTRLANYLLALWRCEPEPHWPSGYRRSPCEDAELAEVLLLTSGVVAHTTTKEERARLDQMIVDSAAEMARVRQWARPERISAAPSTETCPDCPFETLCRARLDD